MSIVSEIGNVDNFWKENAGIILGTAGAIGGGIATGGNPMGIAAGYSVGSSIGQGFESHYEAGRAGSEAAKLQRETLARERSMLITQRRGAIEGSTKVQFGGRIYGSGDSSSIGGPAGGALAASPSLLARGEYTGLAMINPSLGA